jgi:hypothetical protein
MTEEAVFSPILDLQKPQFTEAVYQILVALRHRWIASRASEEELLDHVGFQSSIDPSSSLRPYVQAALHAIEAAEGKGLQNLSDDDLYKYRQFLHNLLSSRSRAGLPRDGVSAAELLARVS